MNVGPVKSATINKSVEHIFNLKDYIGLEKSEIKTNVTRVAVVQEVF